MEKETYLGDGLYVSFDGFAFVLRAPRQNGDHWVALEPEVILNLLDYVKETAPSLLKNHQTDKPSVL